MSNSKKLMSQMERWPDGRCPEKQPRPITSGGGTLRLKGIASRMEIKKKERGSASMAIKAQLNAKKRAYATGRKSGGGK